MNLENIELAEGHVLQKGMIYVVKLPSFAGEGAVPYPASMFMNSLPEGHRFIEATGSRTFEFRNFKLRQAESVRDMRGLAQTYEQEQSGLRPRRIQPGAIGQSDFMDIHGNPKEGETVVSKPDNTKARRTASKEDELTL